MDRSPWRRLVRGRWAFVAFAVILGGLSVGLFDEAGERDDARAVQVVVDNGRLTGARLAFERANVGLLVHHILEGTGQGGLDPTEVAALEDDLQASYAEIQSLTRADGAVGELAAAMVDAIPAELVADPTSDLPRFYDAVDDIRWAGNTIRIDPAFLALFELGFFAALPQHVLVEAAVANAEVEGLKPDAARASLYSEVALVVRREGGWLGPDDATPLADSEWYDTEGAVSAYPEAMDQLEQMYSGDVVTEMDRWVEQFDGSGTSPQAPHSIADMVSAVDALRSEATTLIDGVWATETDAMVRRARHEADTRSDLYVASLVSAIAAAVLGAFSIVLLVMRRRSLRHLSEMALRDALTGVSTRHVLDSRLRADLRESRLDHHALVVIDLDRFKMVNDAFGHTVGDALLREVAARLQSTADTLAAATPGAVRTVVRMGGDEFLLALHAPNQVRVDLLSFELDAARTRPFEVTVDGRTETLMPKFSYGIAEHRGSDGDLDAMIAAADLAAYADKASRVSDRRDVGRETATS